MDLEATFRDGVERHRAGDLPAAEQAYRAVLAAGPHLGALRNLGILLEAEGRLEAAQACYAQVAEVAPDQAAGHYALGNLHRFKGELAAADAAYRRVLALEPGHRDAASDLGLTLLAAGRYAEAWPFYEQRTRRLRSRARSLSFPEWRGEPLAGKRLFVWSEQGYGDQIMLARFVGRLGAAHVTLTCAPALARLFAHLPAQVVSLAAEQQVAPHDYWILPMSIPARIGLTLESIPGAPYLSGTPRPAAGRIGVTARGNPDYVFDAHRSPPPAIRAELLALPGALSLAPEDTGAADFQDTADLVAGLDLVMTSDTSVAHLAGAMGKPVWLLLSAHAVDWRWGQGARTPWYPTMRIYRQPAPGDWASVVAQVRADLAGL